MGRPTDIQSTRFKFTKTALAAVVCPPGKSKIRVHDTEVSGLSMLVTSNGSRAFYFYKWADGRPMEVRIGSADEFTPDQARSKVSTMNGGRLNGLNPAAEKRAAREGATLGDMWTTYHRTVKKGMRTMTEDEGLWRRYLSTLSGRRVKDVTEDMVQRLHDRIAEGKVERKIKDAKGHERTIKGGPTAAVRAVSLLSGIYTECGKVFGAAGYNPVRGIRKEKETACERYLTAEELPAFWTSMKGQSETIQDILKFALFTAQRRSPLLAMRWEEINLTFGTWTIPAAKMKGGKAHTVPLVPQAVEILTRRKKAAGEGEWVFASAESATGYLREPKKALKAIVKAAGIASVTLHDLRRTTATWANSTGASFPTIAAILAHKVPQITGVYAKATADEMRRALTAAVGAIVAAAEASPKNLQSAAGAA